MSEKPGESEMEQPSRIGPFIILEEIGAGGMGTVYLGRHEGNQQIAAVKLLPPALARETGFRLRFAREIEALQSVNSPQIVQLYSNGEDLGTVYYAMEYVAGETLSQRLRRERRLPWRDCVDIVRQLCVALKAAHDVGIVHRDLKPSNILIGINGDVKLTDFGIAQVFAAEKLTMTGGVVGTAEYMSPEQAQGQRATKRSDLYSLGAVLYVMLTGRPPFVGQTSVDILQKHRFGQFDLPSRYVADIPVALDEIISQLLEKDPDKRIPDAFVLSRRLQDLLQAQELRASDMPTTADGAKAVAAQAARRAGPGEATIMRDLVRNELAQQGSPRGLNKVFDNTWVLVTLMVLMLAAVWWFASQGMTDEQRFAKGVALMQLEPGAEWQRARDEYFAPLVAKDERAWGERTADYLSDIAVYELEQSLTPPRRLARRQKTTSEVERQLQHIRQLWDDGHYPQAAAKLQALQQLWEDDPSADIALRVASKWLEELAARAADLEDPTELISRKLQAAEELAGSEPERARQLWRAIVALYDSDPRAAAQVRQARERLRDPEAPNP